MTVKHGMHLENLCFASYQRYLFSTADESHVSFLGHYSTRTINHRHFNYFISRWTRINHFGRELARMLLFNFPRSYNYSLTIFPAELFSLTLSFSPPSALLSSVTNNEAARWENVPLNNVKCF